VSLDSKTGAIYGELSNSVSAGDYNFQITAKLPYNKNVRGDSTVAKLELTVKLLPGVVTYPSGSFTTCGPTTILPSINGAAPTSYSMKPELPLGISLNKQTGEISGQPTKEGGEVPGVLSVGQNSSDVYYVLTASNSVGSSQSKITLKFSNPKTCPTFPWGNVAAVAAAIICIAAFYALAKRKSLDENPYKTVATYESLTATNYDNPIIPVPVNNSTPAVPPPNNQMCVPLTWETGETGMGKEKKTVFATRKPLGLLFDSEAPIRVTGDRDGHGFDLGVRKGWVLAAINYVDVQWMTFDEQSRLLHSEVGKLPGSIPLTFATPEGEMKTAWASQKPLGLIFEQNELPVTISAVRGHSKDIGIQVGWVLHSVNYKVVSELNSYEEVDAIIRSQVSTLSSAEVPKLSSTEAAELSNASRVNTT
jgi:hypothetical protein